MKKFILIIGVIVSGLVFFNDNEALAFGECADYGYGAQYDYLSGTCSCMSGYEWGEDFLGNPTCKTGYSLCTEKYGFMSTYDSISHACGCFSGYVFGEDIFGKKSCVNGDSYCRSNHGLYSDYDSLSSQCDCDSGYTFDEDNQCVKKQNNVYFLLEELDSVSQQAIISSEYDYSRYLVEYGIGCYSFYFNRYLDKDIVVNLGTDFNLDKWDKIVLQNESSTCNILDVEKVDSSFTLEEEVVNENVYSGGSSFAFFSDVNSANKNYLAIVGLYLKGIIKGYPDGTFKPYSSINRAELLKILVEGKGESPVVADYSNCFSDVKTEWFAPYVCYAKGQMWVDGYKDGTFRPSNNITKAEAIKMLLNSQDVQVPESIDQEPFIDVRKGDWFGVYIFRAKQLEILEETGGLYSPNSFISRAGISENLFRILKDEL